MSGDLDGLLDGSRSPGVYRIEGADQPTLAERLTAAGWRTVAVIEPFDLIEEFYDRISAGLGFPRYFGRNLDALWDSLTDLADPTVVIIKGWPRFADARPAEWAGLLSVLTDRTTQHPPFATILTPQP